VRAPPALAQKVGRLSEDFINLALPLAQVLSNGAQQRAASADDVSRGPILLLSGRQFGRRDRQIHSCSNKAWSALYR
jgi:hypothetical protein